MVYTITNGLVTLIQIVLFQIPLVRNWLGLGVQQNSANLAPPSGLLATRPISLSEAVKELKI